MDAVNYGEGRGRETVGGRAWEGERGSERGRKREGVSEREGGRRRLRVGGGPAGRATGRGALLGDVRIPIRIFAYISGRRARRGVESGRGGACRRVRRAGPRPPSARAPLTAGVGGEGTGGHLARRVARRLGARWPGRAAGPSATAHQIGSEMVKAGLEGVDPVLREIRRAQNGLGLERRKRVCSKLGWR